GTRGRPKRGRRHGTKNLSNPFNNQPRARRFSRQMGKRTQSLDAVDKAARIRRDDGLRDEAIAALALPDLRRGESWEGWPKGTTDLAFDPSYRFYARASDDGHIGIYRFADHRQLQRLEGRALQVTLQFSPDSQYLAAYHAATSTLTVWRLHDGRPLLNQVGYYWRPAFTPDGRQVALGNADWVVRFDLATGRELSRHRLPAV